MKNIMVINVVFEVINLFFLECSQLDKLIYVSSDKNFRLYFSNIFDQSILIMNGLMVMGSLGCSKIINCQDVIMVISKLQVVSVDVVIIQFMDFFDDINIIMVIRIVVEILFKNVLIKDNCFVMVMMYLGFNLDIG